MGLFGRSADKPTRGERRAARKAAKKARRDAEIAAAQAVEAAKLAARNAKKDTKAAVKDSRAAKKAAKISDAVAAKQAELSAKAAKVAEKAEKKAAKNAPRLAKQQAKEAKKALKAEAKAVKKEAKAVKKGLKKDGKTAKKAAKKVGSEGSLAAAGALVAAETGSREPFTAARARRLVGAGQVLLPVLAPYALSAVNTARAQWDARKAAKLGIATDQLSVFSGPGGALHARLSHLADALAKLEGLPETKTGSSAKAFVDATRPRLADLSVAVRAAEQMPTARRRAAYKAVGNELDTIESTLLGHLGVHA